VWTITPTIHTTTCIPIQSPSMLRRASMSIRFITHPPGSRFTWTEISWVSWCRMLLSEFPCSQWGYGFSSKVKLLPLPVLWGPCMLPAPTLPSVPIPPCVRPSYLLTYHSLSKQAPAPPATCPTQGFSSASSAALLGSALVSFFAWFWG